MEARIIAVQPRGLLKEANSDIFCAGFNLYHLAGYDKDQLFIVFVFRKFVT
jgi:hypothetical protein